MLMNSSYTWSELQLFSIFDIINNLRIYIRIPTHTKKTQRRNQRQSRLNHLWSNSVTKSLIPYRNSITYDHGSMGTFYSWTITRLCIPTIVPCWGTLQITLFVRTTRWHDERYRVTYYRLYAHEVALQNVYCLYIQ